eukprot:TRINITY_DN5828_c0_g1_i1.p1 TRINITY_DN5828_c0_g1~~TRINITY_DN5828_c0_g1_i1.p1  ORF type:complete len:1434 (+),score=475.28 TRINITY_DN5828_c0_g1_i1:46-4347(+)
MSALSPHSQYYEDEQRAFQEQYEQHKNQMLAHLQSQYEEALKIRFEQLERELKLKELQLLAETNERVQKEADLKRSQIEAQERKWAEEFETKKKNNEVEMIKVRLTLHEALETKSKDKMLKWKSKFDQLRKAEEEKWRAQFEEKQKSDIKKLNESITSLKKTRALELQAELKEEETRWRTKFELLKKKELEEWGIELQKKKITDEDNLKEERKNKRLFEQETADQHNQLKERLILEEQNWRREFDIYKKQQFEQFEQLYNYNVKIHQDQLYQKLINDENALREQVHQKLNDERNVLIEQLAQTHFHSLVTEKETLEIRIKELEAEKQLLAREAALSKEKLESQAKELENASSLKAILHAHEDLLRNKTRSHKGTSDLLDETTEKYKILEESYEKEKEEHEDLKKRIGRMSRDVEELTARAAQLESDLARESERKRELEEQVNLLATKSTAQNQQEKRQLAEASRENERLRAQNADLVDQVREIQQKETSSRGPVNEENAELRTKVSEMTRTLEEKQVAVLLLQTAVSEATRERTRLENRLKEVAHKLEDVEQMRARASEISDQLALKSSKTDDALKTPPQDSGKEKRLSEENEKYQIILKRFRGEREIVCEHVGRIEKILAIVYDDGHDTDEDQIEKGDLPKRLLNIVEKIQEERLEKERETLTVTERTKETVSRLREEAKLLREKNEMLERIETELEEHIQKTKSQEATWNAEREDFQQKLKDLETKMKTQNESNHEEIVQRNSELIETNRTIEKDLEEAREKNERLERELDEIQKELRSVDGAKNEEKISSLRFELETLQTQHEQENSRSARTISSLNQDIEHLQTNIENLESENSKLKRKIDELSENHDETERRIQSLEKDNLELTKAKQMKEELMGEIYNVNKEIQESRKNEEQSQRKLSEAQEKLEKNGSELNSSREEVKRLEKEVERLSNELEQLKRSPQQSSTQVLPVPALAPLSPVKSRTSSLSSVKPEPEPFVKPPEPSPRIRKLSFTQQDTSSHITPSQVNKDAECVKCGKGMTEGEYLELKNGRLIHHACHLCELCHKQLFKDYERIGPKKCCLECKIQKPFRNDSAESVTGSSGTSPKPDSPVLSPRVRPRSSTGSQIWPPPSASAPAPALTTIGPFKLKSINPTVSTSTTQESSSSSSSTSTSTSTSSSLPPFSSSSEPICSGCSKEISGSIMNVDDQKYHPHCFTCSVCSNPITGGSFVRHPTNSKAVCLSCKDKMNSGSTQAQTNASQTKEHQQPPSSSEKVCGECSKPLSGEVVEAAGNEYHEACFVCWQCKSPINGQFGRKDGKPHCSTCLKKKSSSRIETSSSTQVEPPKSNQMMGLLPWVQDRVSQYDCKVTNFVKSWQDGRAICYLLYSYHPELFTVKKIEESNPDQRIDMAYNAISKLGLPELLEQGDFALEKLSMMTQMSALYAKLEKTRS